MKRVALFALVMTFICCPVADALARGPGAPSFKAPAVSIGPTKLPSAGTFGDTSRGRTYRYIPPGSASANPYDTPAVGRSSPAAASCASAVQYRSICRISDNEDGAGGTCRYQTTVSKSRGDKCQCHGQSGTIQ
jgi:hypothetical protein